jgi:hypothetical protein
VQLSGTKFSALCDIVKCSWSQRSGLKELKKVAESWATPTRPITDVRREGSVKVYRARQTSEGKKTRAESEEKSICVQIFNGLWKLSPAEADGLALDCLHSQQEKKTLLFC